VQFERVEAAEIVTLLAQKGLDIRHRCVRDEVVGLELLTRNSQTGIRSEPSAARANEHTCKRDQSRGNFDWHGARPQRELTKKYAVTEFRADSP
jgi:hypothetical protein